MLSIAHNIGIQLPLTTRLTMAWSSEKTVGSMPNGQTGSQAQNAGYLPQLTGIAAVGRFKLTDEIQQRPQRRGGSGHNQTKPTTQRSQHRIGRTDPSLRSSRY